MNLSALRAGLVACALFGILALMGGCATRGTTVTLLPDEDGHVGAVIVSSATGSQKIAEGFSSVHVGSARKAPSAVKSVGQQSVEASFSDLLKAQPLRSRSFVLHFVLDSTALTEESKALLPQVLQTVHERAPTEITVFGHADASGSESHNFKLSMDRARIVADLLRRAEPALGPIDIQAFGDRAPVVVPADPRAPEPRNRRAEIVIL
jgi:peptidoglycan-associated lipoprotein